MAAKFTINQIWSFLIPFSRVDEDMLLGACLDKYLLPESLDTSGNKIIYYQSLGHKGVSVLLKKESSDVNESR